MSVKIKTLKEPNVITFYKMCMMRYGINPIYFRQSFVKPLKELVEKEPSWWKKFIEYAFEFYDELYKRFGHIPCVIRSKHFPEPFIFRYEDIYNFVKQKIIDSECDWDVVKKLAKNLDIQSVDSAWEVVMENVENKTYKPIEVLMAISAYCKLKGKMDLWERFKIKYGSEIKKIL